MRKGTFLFTTKFYVHLKPKNSLVSDFWFHHILTKPLQSSVSFSPTLYSYISYEFADSSLYETECCISNKKNNTPEAFLLVRKKDK